MSAADPFRIEGPALISFSGGRTSAYMLRRILDAHGDELPADVHVAFANTGKERPETLDFAQECSTRWGVHVTWLEYRHDGTGPGFEIVSHNSASRNGEPFDQAIAAKKYLPNPVTRYCTTELKIRTIKRWMVSLGYGHWTAALGIRADEPARVARGRAANEAGKERWDSVWPLHAAGITKPDIMRFWGAQPFDLGLRQHEGNCDLCFLKSGAIIREIMADRPEMAGWWIRTEAAPKPGRSGGATFRVDRPSYAAMLDAVERQHVMDLGDADLLQHCLCGVG